MPNGLLSAVAADDGEESLSKYRVGLMRGANAIA